MKRFVWMGIVLQVVMVVCGHFSERVLNLSAVLGTGIPFVLGLWYGASVPRGLGRSAGGGFVIGIVGAVVGVLAAILMGDQTWMLLTFAPLSSAITGLLGALIGTAMSGRAKTMEA
jgi:hypothetical protein